MSAAKVWINLPNGATHISPTGVFYKRINGIWVYWSTQHKQWMRSYSTLQVEEL